MNRADFLSGTITTALRICSVVTQTEERASEPPQIMAKIIHYSVASCGLENTIKTGQDTIN